MEIWTVICSAVDKNKNIISFVIFHWEASSSVVEVFFFYISEV